MLIYKFVILLKIDLFYDVCLKLKIYNKIECFEYFIFKRYKILNGEWK